MKSSAIHPAFRIIRKKGTPRFDIQRKWTKGKEKLIGATGSTIHTITSITMATPAARLSEPLNSISRQSIVFEAQ
jgi:hypothetical protein